MKKRLVAAAAIAAIAAAAVVGTALSQSGAPLDPDTALDRAFKKAFIVRSHRPDAVSSDMVLQQFTLLGHHDLGAGGVSFADIWVHKHAAYVGTRCANGGGHGVKVVDIARPTAPAHLATLPALPGTSAEDVVVASVSTPSFTGDLAVVGIQACATGPDTGLKFYDVTQPAQPRLLSTWLLPANSWGCHEVDLIRRSSDSRVLAACAKNLNDQYGQGATPPPVPGAVQIVDATNPFAPTLASSWNAPTEWNRGAGCWRREFAHSARFAKGGQELYVSYWDLGTIRLNVANPAAPAPLNQIAIVPTDEEGDSHSLGFANQNRWLVVNPEDLIPEACAATSTVGWGDAYVFDVENPGSPTFLARFNTANGAAGRTDGTYTVHNTESVGKNLFSSWYSDGIVWWTVDGPNAARQIGQFVPPGAPARVWGVAVDPAHRAVLASDMVSGLWLVRPKQPGT